MTPRAEHVVWLDSACSGGWITKDRFPLDCTPMTCQTVGFVVDESRNGLVIALNCASAPNSGTPYGHCITIPKVAIVSRKRLPLILPK